jgi:hypothetical protein
MDKKPFSEVIYEEGPIRVVRIGNWRHVSNVDNHEFLWLFDRTTQDVVDQFFLHLEKPTSCRSSEKIDE